MFSLREKSCEMVAIFNPRKLPFEKNVFIESLSIGLVAAAALLL